MNRNKEAIFDTRPRKRFGEGPIAERAIPLNDRGFNEGAYSDMTAEEIRFTSKDKTLYAIVLAWPEDNKVNIRSLSSGNTKVKRVELLGHGRVKFRQTSGGLAVSLPKRYGI